MEKLTMYGNSMRLIEVCVMKSLCIFIAYAYIRTIKRQREFVQQELLISGIFFACFFVVSLFFIILLKQVMLPRILQIAFAVITLLFLGIILLVLWLLNHLQNQNRELLEQYFSNSVEGAGETDESIRGKQPKNPRSKT